MRTYRQSGFAMLLVVILMAMGVVLGMSYLSVAAMHVQVSRNFQQVSRARYLAESGLQHGLYILRTDPQQLDNTVAHPLGPYYADATSDGYVIFREDLGPGLYRLTATGVVGGQWQGSAAKGGIRRTSSADVFRTPAPRTKQSQSLLISGGIAQLPASATLNGDFHINGWLFNYANVNGNASATQSISDPYGRITGAETQFAGAVTPPTITPAQYASYYLDGKNCTAATFSGTQMLKTNALANGGAVTANNVGGVVRLTASGGTVALKTGLNFTGTLVINGNLVLDGPTINLTAVDGFPAIVCTGSVTVNNSAKNVVINGLVVAGRGIVKGSGNSANTSTTINGGLVSSSTGYDTNLGGTHVLNYRKDRAQIYDFSLPLNQQTPKVTVVAWND